MIQCMNEIRHSCNKYNAKTLHNANILALNMVLWINREISFTHSINSRTNIFNVWVAIFAFSQHLKKCIEMYVLNRLYKKTALSLLTWSGVQFEKQHIYKQTIVWFPCQARKDIVVFFWALIDYAVQFIVHQN